MINVKDINSLQLLNDRRKTTLESSLNAINHKIETVKHEISIIQSGISQLKRQIIQSINIFNHTLEQNIVGQQFIKQHKYNIEYLNREIAHKEDNKNKLLDTLNQLYLEQDSLRLQLRKIIIKQEKYDYLLSV